MDTAVENEAQLARLIEDAAGLLDSFTPSSESVYAKVLTYAYLTGNLSSREIVSRWQHADYAVLVSGLPPAHEALAEFRRCHAIKLADAITELLALCQSAGLQRLGYVPLVDLHFGGPKGADRLHTEVSQLVKTAETVDVAEDLVYGTQSPPTFLLPPEMRSREARVGALLQARERMLSGMPKAAVPQPDHAEVTEPRAVAASTLSKTHPPIGDAAGGEEPTKRHFRPTWRRALAIKPYLAHYLLVVGLCLMVAGGVFNFLLNLNRPPDSPGGDRDDEEQPVQQVAANTKFGLLLVSGGGVFFVISLALLGDGARPSHKGKRRKGLRGPHPSPSDVPRVVVTPGLPGRGS